MSPFTTNLVAQATAGCNRNRRRLHFKNVFTMQKYLSKSFRRGFRKGFSGAFCWYKTAGENLRCFVGTKQREKICARYFVRQKAPGKLLESFSKAPAKALGKVLLRCEHVFKMHSSSIPVSESVTPSPSSMRFSKCSAKSVFCTCFQNFTNRDDPFSNYTNHNDPFSKY